MPLTTTMHVLETCESIVKGEKKVSKPSFKLQRVAAQGGWL